MDGRAWEFGLDQNFIQLDRARNALDENNQLVELESVHELNQALRFLIFLHTVIVLQQAVES